MWRGWLPPLRCARLLCLPPPPPEKVLRVRAPGSYGQRIKSQHSAREQAARERRVGCGRGGGGGGGGRALLLQQLQLVLVEAREDDVLLDRVHDARERLLALGRVRFERLRGARRATSAKRRACAKEEQAAGS
eukprot:4125996-Pleurochrysis_carterae.AAC.1